MSRSGGCEAAPESRGGYWGLLIVGSRNPGSLIPATFWDRRGVATLQVLFMFALTNLGWLLFRETDLHYLINELTLRPWAAASADWEAAAYFASLVCIYSLPLVVHFLGILVLRTANSGDFIYFKF
jgi:hypothetical protein